MRNKYKFYYTNLQVSQISEYQAESIPKDNVGLRVKKCKGEDIFKVGLFFMDFAISVCYLIQIMQFQIMACINYIMQIQAKSQPQWKGILAGMISAFFVSPTNAILDRSVIEYANGKNTIKQGVKSGFLKMFKTPLQFFISFKFRWMYFVYAMTYSANNLTDHSQIIPGISIPLQNLMCTFVTNTICGIAKDKAYAQHFGASSPKSFPVVSLGLFFLRDIITVASAFTFPPILGKWIEKQWGYSERTSKTIAQLSCPLLIQLVVTPLHLLGLDIYNREGKNIGNRIKHISTLYTTATSMRMIRFLPAYGIGGVINTELRSALKQ